MQASCGELQHFRWGEERDAWLRKEAELKEEREAWRQKEELQEGERGERGEREASRPSLLSFKEAEREAWERKDAEQCARVDALAKELQVAHLNHSLNH
jgi:hypothetical protein